MSDHSRRILIGADELAAAIDQQAAQVVVDVRWLITGPSQYLAYLAGHLPGARWCDLDTDLADPPGRRGRHPLPDPARLQAKVREWGIDPQSEVVVYDQDTSVAAARAWWVLRWAGIERVRVLDGGLAAWLRAGHGLQTELPRPGAGSVVVRPGSLPVLDADTAAIWAGQGRLLDVRAPERFRGEVEPMDPVAGRIPGALNLPTTANVQPSGEFRSDARLRRRFEDAAVTGRPAPVGVYCGSGVTAAHTVLAMRIAGVEAVLYPGSWSEWVTDPGRPVERG